MQDQHLPQVVDIWKTVINVQQHFNDISMRIRGMFITILLALFASIGFLLDKRLGLNISRIEIQYTTLLPLFGIFGTWLFYFMDRYWYHRLLTGSVKHAIEIEKKYQHVLPELSLSKSIGAESPYKPRGIVRFAAILLVSHDRFKKDRNLHSDGKIELFYKSVMVILVLTTILIAFLGGITVKPASSLPSQQASMATRSTQAPGSKPFNAPRDIRFQKSVPTKHE